MKQIDLVKQKLDEVAGLLKTGSHYEAVGLYQDIVSLLINEVEGNHLDYTELENENKWLREVLRGLKIILHSTWFDNVHDMGM